MNSYILEALLIDDDIIGLEAFFSNSNNISDSEVRNSPYYNLPDRELATAFVDQIGQNINVQMATEEDQMVCNYLNFLRMTSAYYFKYNISSIPVAVTKKTKSDREVNFVLYAYIPKQNKTARPIGYSKSNLIRFLIQSEKRRY